MRSNALALSVLLSREKSVAKNHGGSRCLGKFSLLGNVWHLAYHSKYVVGTATRPPSNNHLHRVQCSSFPPEGVPGTSVYHLKYYLHLIKIPSHLNRESINMPTHCSLVTQYLRSCQQMSRQILLFARIITGFILRGHVAIIMKLSLPVPALLPIFLYSCEIKSGSGLGMRLG